LFIIFLACLSQTELPEPKKLNPNFDPARYRKLRDRDYQEGLKFVRSQLPKMLVKQPDWSFDKSKSATFKAGLVGPVSGKINAQPITKIQIPLHITPFWGLCKDAFRLLVRTI